MSTAHRAGAEAPLTGPEAPVDRAGGPVYIRCMSPDTKTTAAERLAIALAQVNPTVGDIAGNAKLIREARDQAVGADLVVTGELAISGYPPEDLVLKSAFQDTVEAAIGELAGETADGPALLVGAPWRDGAHLHNAALLLDDGAIAAVTYKHCLPNYGVFDEKRVFEAGPLPQPMICRGHSLGVMVCEDMWFPHPATALARRAGAEMLIVLNGSPFETDKLDERLDYAKARVADTGLSLIYVNLIGGQDELVFDGASFVLGANGETDVRAPAWERAVVNTEWGKANGTWSCRAGTRAPAADLTEAVYRAMVVGLRDYVHKNGFPGVVLGLSGGIDSALSMAVAVDALGAANVHAVMMPSPYTSTESLEDAAQCAEMLGVQLDEVSIEPAMKAFDQMLAPLFEGMEADVTEENIQSRARGNLLMAISNKMGHMLLTTGNKSEMSVGYATLYGDMCGGYSVLKDIYKTDVFKLSHWRNQNRPADVQGPEGRVIPERIITKPPSAELKPDQKDEDSLPPYEVLDGILKCLVEDEMSVAAAVERGFEADTVRRIWRMLDLAEYKRRQAPPGVKTTRRAFGRDRRYPITNRFRGHI